MLLFIPYKVYADDMEEGDIAIEVGMVEAEVNEKELDLTDGQSIDYNYQVTLNNLYLYNIVALNNAEVKQHTYGSVFTCGVLSGNQPIDGSDNYVYNNNSTISNYKLLNYDSIETNRNYWSKLIEDLVYGDESFIYLEPDENGQVSLSQDNNSVERVFYTNASVVNASSFSGHLIAPFADVYIGAGSYYGAVIGWNVYCEGEGHPTSYVFARPEPHEKGPNPGVIKLKKTLVNNLSVDICDLYLWLKFLFYLLIR